jgi:SAM-dependent methyltransferase
MFSEIKKNYEFYKKRYFRGRDIFCPFCTGSYRSEKFELTKETSTGCPVCSSTIEERTVLLFLQAKTDIMSGEKKVLVVSDKGMISGYFEKFPNAELKIFNETGDFTIRDNTLKNKFESGYFDLIVCNYVLEKLPDYISVLKEFNRILKPDGLIMLQANVNSEKEKTEEFPLTSYNDRLIAYGIPGNHRRFGKDYADLIRAQGLKVSRLKFTEGFDALPEMSFKKDEVIYIVHKTEKPLLSDNMDDLEAQMKEQESNVSPDRYGKFLYILFFIIPHTLKKLIRGYFDSVDERSSNKAGWPYFFHMILIGTVSMIFGTAVYVFPLVVRFPGGNIVFILISLPVFLFCLALTFMSIVGYYFVNYDAGIVRRTIMGLFGSVIIMSSMAFAIMLLMSAVSTMAGMSQ